MEITIKATPDVCNSETGLINVSALTGGKADSRTDSKHEVTEGSMLMSPGGTPKDKRAFKNSRWRFLMLFFACCFLIGSYFCYDNPGVIETPIEELFNISSTQFSFLYGVYSYPNTVLPIFGGIFLDTIGIRIGVILFSTFLTLGQIVFCIGGYKTEFWLMLVGRTIFGLGGESLSVT